MFSFRHPYEPLCPKSDQRGFFYHILETSFDNVWIELTTDLNSIAGSQTSRRNTFLQFMDAKNYLSYFSYSGYLFNSIVTKRCTLE